MNRDPRRWWALGALTLAVLAGGLDGTILSVALPTLAGALKATETDLEWFTSGYLLVLAAAMLPAGLLGDRFGRKKVLLGSLVLFGAGSIACAFSRSPGEFIAARTVLGLACSGLIVMALSSLTVLFDEAERPKAVGVWGAANFLATPIGPVLGGWLLTRYWWGWVFLMNVPVVLVGLLAAIVLIPESRAARKPGLDLAGILLSSGGLAIVTFGLIAAGRDGWTSASALVPLATGAGTLMAFGWWETRTSEPLVDLALFRSRAFTWGVLLAGAGVLAMVGVLFTMPQYFQAVAGTDAMGSGLRLLPLVGGLVIGAIPADRVAAFAGRKVTVGFGFAVMAVAYVVAAQTTVESAGWFTGTWMAGLGFGMGLALATSASAALGELSEEHSGVGSAVMQALQKLGGPFGAAILGSVLANVYRSGVDVTGLPAPAAAAVRDSVFAGVALATRTHSPALLESVRTAFVSGMDAALVLAVGVAVAGGVLGAVFLPARPARAELGEIGRVAPAIP
jgi:MFS transporter, DHA2 family, multidrug resistance protein